MAGPPNDGTPSLPPDIMEIIDQLPKTEEGFAMADKIAQLFWKGQRVDKLEKMVAYYRWIAKGSMEDEDFDKLFES